MQVCVVHPQKTWLCAHRLWLWLRLAFLFNQDPRARFSMSFVQSLVLIPVLHGGFPLASWKVYTIFLLQPRGHSRVRLEMSKKCQLPPLLACLWSYSDSFLTHQLRSAFRIVFFFQLFYSAFLAVDRGRVTAGAAGDKDTVGDHCQPGGLFIACIFPSLHLSLVCSLSQEDSMVQCEQCSACLWPRFPYSGIPAAARGLGFPLISRRGSHWPSAFFKALMELNLLSFFPPWFSFVIVPS